jgi:hypothetical protein
MAFVKESAFSMNGHKQALLNHIPIQMMQMFLCRVAGLAARESSISVQR